MCREHDDALVDLARGAELEPARLDAVRAHLARCAACRARLVREEALTAGLGALSKATADARASAALESRLLEAFQAAASAKATTGHAASAKATARSVALAAAAVVALAVIPAWLLEPPPKPAPKPAPKAAARQEPPVPGPLPVADRPGQQPPAVTAGSTRVRPRRAPQRDGGILRPADFVALPGALGLPQFESGVIARIEIPVTSLPTYGIQIAPDAARSTVPADILVGQDGLARAIRLVRISTATRSTQ